MTRSPVELFWTAEKMILLEPASLIFDCVLQEKLAKRARGHGKR